MLTKDFKEFVALLHARGVEYLDLNFIGIDALKANKRASGRARDIDDLEQLGS